DRDEVVDAEPFQVLQHFGCQIVALGLVAFLQVRWNFILLYAAGIGARRVQERATGASSPIDALFSQMLEIVAIVVVLFPNHIDQACPSAAQTDNFVSLAQRPDRNRTNRGIQPWDVATARQYADDASLTTSDSHVGLVSLSTNECKELV